MPGVFAQGLREEVPFSGGIRLAGKLSTGTAFYRFGEECAPLPLFVGS